MEISSSIDLAALVVFSLQNLPNTISLLLSHLYSEPPSPHVSWFVISDWKAHFIKNTIRINDKWVRTTWSKSGPWMVVEFQNYHQIRVVLEKRSSQHMSLKSDTQSNECSLHTMIEGQNQQDSDSKERSQHAITPHHNYHYHSGTTNNAYTDV
jgi:hypothetical protein